MWQRSCRLTLAAKCFHGGNEYRKKQDVLLPETGAAKYWYVDPRASGVAAPNEQPFNPQGYSQESGINPMVEAINRLLGREQSTPAVYDPMQEVRLARQQEFDPSTYQMGPQDVYKTIGLNIQGEEWEVPAVYDNMTDEDRNIIHYLPHTQWPKSIMEKIEENARNELEQGNDPYGNPIKPFQF
jgi:hypothetical protein